VTPFERRFAEHNVVEEVPLAQPLEDARIHSRVRSVLARRWVDLKRLNVGTINGVVHIEGELRQSLSLAPSIGEGKPSLQFVRKIERELRAIAGVRDVVFSVSGFEKVGAEWRRKAS
jgi:hypothetical protein